MDELVFFFEEQLFEFNQGFEFVLVEQYVVDIDFLVVFIFFMLDVCGFVVFQGEVKRVDFVVVVGVVFVVVVGGQVFVNGEFFKIFFVGFRQGRNIGRWWFGWIIEDYCVDSGILGNWLGVGRGCSHCYDGGVGDDVVMVWVVQWYAFEKLGYNIVVGFGVVGVVGVQYVVFSGEFWIQEVYD